MLVAVRRVDKQARNLKLKEIEKRSQTHKETQIFIETPYRNQHMLEAILATCNANTRLCIAAQLSMLDEFIVTKRISEWKQSTLPDLHKKPTVFLLFIWWLFLMNIQFCYSKFIWQTDLQSNTEAGVGVAGA